MANPIAIRKKAVIAPGARADLIKMPEIPVKKTPIKSAKRDFEYVDFVSTINVLFCYEDIIFSRLGTV